MKSRGVRGRRRGEQVKCQCSGYAIVVINSREGRWRKEGRKGRTEKIR